LTPFRNEAEAREHLEGIRWPNGPVCPHCGGTVRNLPLNGKSHRAGLYFCGDCREQFTVTVGTVFERSKVPLRQWLLAAYVICSNKDRISSKQIERLLGVSYKTAWLINHRIRNAMEATAVARPRTTATYPLGANRKGVRTRVEGTYREKHANEARSGGD
jgi:transposase-like protein